MGCPLTVLLWLRPSKPASGWIPEGCTLSMSAFNRLVVMGYVIILRFVTVYSWRVSALLAAKLS